MELIISWVNKLNLLAEEAGEQQSSAPREGLEEEEEEEDGGCGAGEGSAQLLPMVFVGSMSWAGVHGCPTRGRRGWRSWDPAVTADERQYKITFLFYS